MIEVIEQDDCCVGLIGCNCVFVYIVQSTVDEWVVYIHSVAQPL